MDIEMDICGEHGDDIAYSGRDCPACAQIEDINRDHQEELVSLKGDMQSEIDELNDEVDDLNGKST